MGCFPCISSLISRSLSPPSSVSPFMPSSTSQIDNLNLENRTSTLTFTFQELEDATENFSPECLIGVGSYGKIYMGKLKETGQVVTIEHLDKIGSRGNREFLVEVLMLSLLNHPNLIDLVGYCAAADERLLVRDYLPLGSLDQHLHDFTSKQKPIDWYTRMKIALGVSRGLEYLHDKAKPPVIYRNLKPYNIFLDNDYNAKLSDFGLSKLGPAGDKAYVSTRVMGTYGYIAPEYQRTGQLTVKSDVYSFGVVLLELITGRKAVDITRVSEEQNLVSWVHSIMKDPKKVPELADRSLMGDFPAIGFKQAVRVAAMCVQEEEAARPPISDVVSAMTYISTDQSHSLLSTKPGLLNKDLMVDNLEEIEKPSL